MAHPLGIDDRDRQAALEQAPMRQALVAARRLHHHQRVRAGPGRQPGDPDGVIVHPQTPARAEITGIELSFADVHTDHAIHPLSHPCLRACAIQPFGLRRAAGRDHAKARAQGPCVRSDRRPRAPTPCTGSALHLHATSAQDRFVRFSGNVGSFGIEGWLRCGQSKAGRARGRAQPTLQLNRNRKKCKMRRGSARGMRPLKASSTKG